MPLTVDVVGPAPWGFRISGGRDFHTPIIVTKVTERGKAEAADLRPGDIIVAINGESAESMLHAEAQSKIRQSASPLRLQLDRSQPASPGQTNGEGSLEVVAARFQGSLRTHHASQSSKAPGYFSQTSLSPRPGSPFSTPRPTSPFAVSGEDATGCSFQSLTHSPGPDAPHHLPYPGHPTSQQVRLLEGRRWRPCYRLPLAPLALTAAGNTRTACGSIPLWQTGHRSPSNSAVRVPLHSPGPRSSSPRFSSLDLEEDSEVFKMLQENRQRRAAPRQSSSFRLLQEALEAEERGGTPAFVPSSLSPQASLGSATPPKLHTCEKCSANISNQAVRIQEGRYRHPGCYTCADCGLNLKMRGHFWVGNELYCEKHARQRYSVPGTLSSRA
ncbi:PDZ and LIM domain protein 2 isoform X1 [Mesocricetus auratus]|nr:PDZ and LIM domain protein 2 isoform X1 [Mesocricetus auratus]XP_040591839.1 PDZ and LIM domain protein 2 isoform X1 [Mesocricetus auratus]XP_040591885.1 PDZ and LIM domain protein 2 isoform X1 [Mesocricetus auratus]